MSLQMFDDSRTIYRIVFEDDSIFEVGNNGVTRIEAYKEAGDYGCVPYFAIWRGDVITDRVNGRYIAIVRYQKS